MMEYSTRAHCFWILIIVVVKSDFLGAKPVPCNFGAQLNNTGEECRVCPNATCPKGKDEVCGSNSITYNSACELYREACRKRTTSLFVFKKGACGFQDMDCSLIQCTKTPYEDCPEGRVQDVNGCSKCQCRNRLQQPCPLLSTCLIACRFGYIIHTNTSCPICKCKELINLEKLIG